MKIKIGIPRGFLYYRDYILFKNFFEGIGCTLILSPPTNKGIIDKGGNISIDESCLPSKIYLGHVKELSQKFTDIINNDGKVEKVEELGKKRLAYEVKKNKEGYYVVINFEANPELISELERNYRIMDEVIKFITVRAE